MALFTPTQSARTLIGIGNIVPSTFTNFSAKGRGYWVAMKTIIDLLYKDWCVYMQTPNILRNTDSYTATGESLSPFASLINTTGLPLIGFQFQQPKNFEILKYSYSKYPYLNRAVVANNMLKETTKITIQGLRPITVGNSVLVNAIVNNIGLKSYIEKYCDLGGLWWINTMWGARFNYVLTDLKGTLPVGEGIGGVGWEFTFERLNFDSMASSEKKTSSKVSFLSA